MASKLSTFGLVVRHETRVLIADRTLPLVVLLLLLLLGYGLLNGFAQASERDSAASSVVSKQVDNERATIAQLRRVMTGTEKPQPFDNPVDPADIGGSKGARYAVVPTTALAALAFGQSDMIPNSYKVTYKSKVSFMYDSEIENPWNLLSGHFDVAFVITYLLPLLIFALSYNLLAGEREQGTLKMLLSQPLTLMVLVLGKISARAVVLLGVAILLPVLAMLAFQPTARGLTQLTLLGGWALLVLAYGLFWFALVVIVNALGRSSATNALILIGSWVTLVLIVPVVLNLAVSAASPAPSRTDLATQTRLITIDGLNRYNDLLGADYRYTAHPETLIPVNGRITVPTRMRGLFLLQQHTDQRIQSKLDEFDQQLAGQQRLVDRFGVLSPAIIVQEGMAALAGNGSGRYLRFHDQVDSFHAAWKGFFLPRVEQGVAITEADFATMPKWQWHEEKNQFVQADALRRILIMLGMAAVVAALAGWRLRRYAVI